MRELVGRVRARAQALVGEAELAVERERARPSQCSNHFSRSLGCTKNSSSACSNSRERNVKLRGLISLRNALPICAIPNGIFWRAASRTRLKSLKIGWQVSARR